MPHPIHTATPADGFSAATGSSAPLARPYPTDVEVASFTGRVPPVSAFRRTGAGVGADGRRLFYVFRIKDGVVTADVVDNGLTLIVR